MAQSSIPKKSSPLDRRVSYYPHPSNKDFLDCLQYNKNGCSMSALVDEFVREGIRRIPENERRQMMARFERNKEE